MRRLSFTRSSLSNSVQLSSRCSVARRNPRQWFHLRTIRYRQETWLLESTEILIPLSNHFSTDDVRENYYALALAKNASAINLRQHRGRSEADGRVFGSRVWKLSPKLTSRDRARCVRREAESTACQSPARTLVLRESYMKPKLMIAAEIT